MTMRVALKHILAPKTGFSLMVARGRCLRVTDLEGGQRVDMVVFRADNPREKLSTSYSRTRYQPKPGRPFVLRDRLTEGNTLMSSRCRPLMRIVEESPEPKGIHDVHGRMCNRTLYDYLGAQGQEGCHEILAAAVARHGIAPEAIPDAIGLFANVQHNCVTGRWELAPPVSRAGDHIEFLAEVDCLVGLSNCPDGRAIDGAQGGRLTPVKVELIAR